jgi:hypothetical protein
MIRLDASRIRAVVRKELRDYRRKRSIVVTMSILPFLFLIQPLLTVFLTSASKATSSVEQTLTISLLYLLLIPVIMPATLSAYAVAGEREQGTLEPLLTTPLRRQEFIVGKAAAVMIPTLVLSYTVFGLFLAAVELFAHPVIASVVFHDGPVLLALFLFTPLLAGWAIVVGMAISVRANEVRVAQQLATLASFPIVAVVVLLAVGTIHETFSIALLFALGLLAIDSLALRIVSGMFDRERLVTGAKAATTRTTRPKRQPAPVTPGPRAPIGTGVPLTATLHLSRKWGGAIDRNREWQVVMDGSVVGAVANQKTVELPVAPGQHTLQLTSRRHSSPERSFEVSDGQVVRFSCRGAMAWPIYVAALIKPDLWISLKQH